MVYTALPLGSTDFRNVNMAYWKSITCLNAYMPRARLLKAIIVHISSDIARGSLRELNNTVFCDESSFLHVKVVCACVRKPG